MKDALSKIYFDDRPVQLLGDESRPRLERIVHAGGKSPEAVDVLVLAARKDKTGHLLRAGEVIDRTVEPAKPIYLRSVPKVPHPGVPMGAPLPEKDAVIEQLGLDPAERKAGRDRRMRERDEADAFADTPGRKPPVVDGGG